MRTPLLSFLIFSCLLVLYSCTQTAENAVTTKISSDSNTYYREKYRLAYHFSLEQNWMNDPNGLVYYQGEYHLFYQYNPKGTTWGNMSWGHAVSTDLVHWEHLPVALEMEDGVMIFSGSAVVDRDNSSGLCESADGCLIAIYTAHTDEMQNQAIAYSNDKGRTWTKYKGNPVLDLGKKDFRDPKVFWYEPEQKWVMAVALPQEHQIQFYTSINLKEWKLMSAFGPQGFVEGIWECPDLFELEVAGSNQKKWVLLVSYNTEVEEKGSEMQYFVGDFDGKTFTNDNTNDLVLTLDDGPDFYAGVTWNNAPDNKRLLIGWLNNWKYANDIPTSTWRSAQSVVRELALQEYPEGIRLVQQPVEALQKLRQAHTHEENMNLKEGESVLALNNINGTQIEIIAEFAYESIDTPAEADMLAAEFGFKVFKGQSQETVIGYDIASQSLFVDRTQSVDTTFAGNFAVKSVGLMPTDSGTVKLHIYVDHSSVEVFGENGYITMSNRIFPDPQQDGVEVYAIGGKVKLNSLDIWELASIWPATRPSAEAIQK